MKKTTTTNHKYMTRSLHNRPIVGVGLLFFKSSDPLLKTTNNYFVLFFSIEGKTIS